MPITASLLMPSHPCVHGNDCLTCPSTDDAQGMEKLCQRGQEFGALQVPHLDGTVIAATGEQTTIRADPKRLDRSLMPFSHPYTLPALYVPPAQHSVAASTDQQLSTLTPLHGQHTAGSAGKGVQVLSIVCIPQEHLSLASLPLAPATTGELAAIGTPHHARDHAAMPLQPLEQRTVGDIPQGYTTIIATASQACAIRTPGHATEHGRVHPTDPSLGAPRHVPHLHPMQIAPSGQQVPIRTPGDGMEGVVGVVGVL